MSAPVLTVIIVSWNVRDLLGACLASLFRETTLPDASLQVIVVDNASGDGTAAMIRSDFPRVSLLEPGENLGFGRANTLAFTQAEAPLVLLLNPDTVVLEGGVDRMVDHMQAKPDIVALGCRLCNADGSLQRWTGGAFPSLGNVAAHYLAPAGLLTRVGRDTSVYLARDVAEDIDVDWLSGACLMLRRARTPSPLFDPTYWMYGEDIDLCHRIRQQGGRVVYTPSVTIMHYQGASMHQQSGDVLLTSLKGMRQFYARGVGPIRTFAFDGLTIAGFALRTVLYGLAAATLRRDRMREKARTSARNTWIAVRLMCG